MKIWRIASGMAFVLTMLFGVTIGLIRARPYDDGGLREFLLAPVDCPAPCWNGLRLYYTRYEEALVLLGSSETIENLGSDMRADNGHIFWKWIAVPPPFLRNTAEVGYANVEKNIISGLYLPGFRSFLDVWLTFGVPQQVIVYSNALWGIENVVYLAVYPDQVYVASAIFCAATPRDLWMTAPSVFIGDMPQYSALYEVIYEPGDFKGWLPSPLC